MFPKCLRKWSSFFGLMLRASLISLPPPSCGSLFHQLLTLVINEISLSILSPFSMFSSLSLQKLKKKKIGTTVCTLTKFPLKCEPLSIPTSFLCKDIPLLFLLPHICSAGALMLALHHMSSAYQFNLIFSNTIWSRSSFKPF